MTNRTNRRIAMAAAISIIGLGAALTGCSNNKPANTTAPGSEHVAAEKQDDRDVETVHTSNANTSTATQSTDGK